MMSNYGQPKKKEKKIKKVTTIFLTFHFETAFHLAQLKKQPQNKQTKGWKPHKNSQIRKTKQKFNDQTKWFIWPKPKNISVLNFCKKTEKIQFWFKPNWFFFHFNPQNKNKYKNQLTCASRKCSSLQRTNLSEIPHVKFLQNSIGMKPTEFYRNYYLNLYNYLIV